MKKSVAILLTLGATAFAYVDTDFDGVEDSADRCPGTPLSELVDREGCTIASTLSPHRFDLISGISYIEGSRLEVAREGDDTLAFSLQADYYYKRYAVQLTTSLYDSENGSGMNDTLLAGYYRFELSDRLSGRVGAGVVLPTYETGFDNEAADYQASAAMNYRVGEALDLFGGVSYTIINDDDVYDIPDIGDVRYRNTAAWMVGAGYVLSPKFYGSLSYGRSDSIYRDSEALENVSLFALYNFSDTLFATFSYSAGLSDSTGDNAVALRIGRYF